MSIEHFVQAMPKVEVNLQLEGSIPVATLVVIAEQNDVPIKNKRFKQWLKHLESVEHANLTELIKETSRWVQQPEDFTRIVYEIGVSLAKQNVQYAEIGFTPTLYAESGLTFEQMLIALNDGRERVQRAWNVQMNWILYAMRDEGQHLDDVIKWATGAAAAKGGVVGIGLGGREVKGWVEQFERPMRTAQKKNLPRALQLLDSSVPVAQVLEHFDPERLVIGLGAVNDREAVQKLTDQKTPVNVCMAQAILKGSIGSYAEFPLRQLVDDGASVSVGSGMPTLYSTSLSQEYLAVLRHGRLSLQELEQISLNAIDASFLSGERKSELKASFSATYSALRSDYAFDAEATF